LFFEMFFAAFDAQKHFGGFLLVDFGELGG
jgi:hypothetical protein